MYMCGELSNPDVVGGAVYRRAYMEGYTRERKRDVFSRFLKSVRPDSTLGQIVRFSPVSPRVS